MWITRRKVAVALLIISGASAAHAQPRISEDRDLKEIDLTGWNCLDQPGGSAKSADGQDRNREKNRSPVDLGGLTIPKLDTAGFLKLVEPFDTTTKGRRRKDLSPAEVAQLESLQKQVVSLTAYLVLAYAGPPESTNCGSVDFHDWHLETFEQPMDHSPAIGDPTPIICEITPRTQNAIFRDGARIQDLAGFFRRPDLVSESTGHKAKLVRITGLLTWDDEHNGAADIGTAIQKFAANGYHQPWRSTAWEIHPVLKIEPADAASVGGATATSTPLRSSTRAAALAAPTAAAADVTIVDAVKVKLKYGEAVLQPGTKLPFVSRDGAMVSVKYGGESIVVPVESTDLRSPR